MLPVRVTLLVACCLLLGLPAVAQVQVLASGQVDLPHTTTGPGSPEFNFPVTRMHTLPLGLGSTAGARLVVSLRDISQPDQLCDPNDPSGGLFDGCATIDWPFPGRRGINLVELELSTGIETFHLRMNDELSDTPEPDGP